MYKYKLHPLLRITILLTNQLVVYKSFSWKNTNYTHSTPNCFPYDSPAEASVITT